ncbi:MAG: phosphoenolpyruvate carboxylase [Pseudomonadales bacterium]|nr:phosphoenolpyruvate carboxylase [Pseudomonadales bacterium]
MEEPISRRLRHRVRILGELLGETMLDQHGSAFLEKVEEIRLLAKKRRQEGGSIDALQDVLKSLDDEYLVSVARAFNQFLNLANIAEQAETTAIRRAPFPEVSNLDDLFKRFAENEEIDNAKLVETIREMKCELVLTAHPTEITRRTLIQKYNRIAAQLEVVTEDVELRPDKRRELERLIAEVWYTDEIRTERPTPQDEAKWGYAVIEHSFWTAIPRIWEGLEQLLKKYTGEELPLTAAPITVASWMGGDRDGNPNVTAEVTDEVIRLARWMAADLYLRDIEDLLAQLSMTVCSKDVLALCGEESHEPYRSLLRQLRERLTATRQWAGTFDAPPPGLIMSRQDLFDPLYACYRSLHECGMGIIAEGLLKRTLIRVSTFGVTLVDLDIRQNADKHEALMDALTNYLDIGSYKSWSEKARQDFLVDELESKRPLIPEQWKPEPEVQETLDTFNLIAENNAEGVASYVISMAKNPSDVLAVVLLLKKCGLSRRLPVVPLFETLQDLENAAWTLERLLRIPWYTNYVAGHQQVMIGYSDSAKDAGQMAAAWAQYRAQEDLVTISEKYNVKLTLFHGRGGAPGRGGGPARAAILSQPPGSVKHSMRVTEQGEMIRFKYGSEALALTNLDLVLSATIEASLMPPAKPRENWRLLMDKMAIVARESYREIVRDDPCFIDYFEQGTPERELAKLALGSRPARRSGTDNRTIEDLRAIPWVFAWTQKRLMLPAWLGTDAAFEQHLSGKDLYVLKEMIAEWPFFQTQLAMLEMVLSKADVDIAEEYDKVLVEPQLQEFAARFRQRMTELVKIVNTLRGQDDLLSGNVEFKRSLELRHPYTDPLQFLQVELLRRSRAADTENPSVDKALLVTIAGIAASMRNTG